MKQMILTAIMAGVSVATFATETSSTTASVEEPKGKAIVQVFTNFHTGFGSMNDKRGFDLDRSYLGYEYSLGKGLKVKGVMDIGKSSDVNDYQRIAYIKNAMISWKYKNLTLNGGLISTTQFNLQEKFWGNRYIMKSFQDQFGFGSSADLGFSVAYKFANWISADVILTNGEGYKKLQIEDGLQYGAGVTLNPIKNLTLRVYGSINEASDKTNKDTYNLATFIGYKNKLFTIGGEYNMANNYKNVSDSDLHGISFYGSVKLGKVADFFARYDQLFAKHEADKQNEEKMVAGGVEFKVCKYVKIAPNFRYTAAQKGVKDQYMGYISCYFGI